MPWLTTDGISWREQMPLPACMLRLRETALSGTPDALTFASLQFAARRLA